MIFKQIPSMKRRFFTELNHSGDFLQLRVITLLLFTNKRTTTFTVTIKTFVQDLSKAKNIIVPKW